MRKDYMRLKDAYMHKGGDPTTKNLSDLLQAENPGVGILEIIDAEVTEGDAVDRQKERAEKEKERLQLKLQQAMDRARETDRRRKEAEGNN